VRSSSLLSRSCTQVVYDVWGIRERTRKEYDDMLTPPLSFLPPAWLNAQVRLFSPFYFLCFLSPFYFLYNTFLLKWELVV
jgi:hypothetical protein